MYITIEDLKTHAHEAIIKKIINNDETIAHACIDMAEELTRSKLAKEYDVETIFAQQGNHRNALLMKVIKDIAIWELIGLTNPSVDYNDKKFRYEQSLNWLNAVYKGMPANLPKKDDNPQKTSSFSYHSNKPRNHHY